MPYMIYQQYKTAVKQAYRGADNIEELYASARSCRSWLASLKIDPKLRNELVEPLTWVEEAFEELLAKKDLA